MNNSTIIAMVSMQALQQKLDVLANNIANANTNGFKRKDATFQNILTNIKDQPKGFQRVGRLTPLGITQSWGSKLSQVQLSLTQGILSATSVPTDLAIEGAALFEISQNTVDANGANIVRKAYTRDGSFDLKVNPADPDNLYLSTKAGDYVNGVDGLPVKIPMGYQMVINSTGTVKAAKTGEIDQNVAQLKLVRIIRPQFLEQTGSNIYALPVGANNANGQILQDVNGNASDLIRPVAVRQGYTEQSNVDLGLEMTDLMTTQRAFQLSSRVITSSDTMMNLANNLRG